MQKEIEMKQPEPVACANCERVGHYAAYHDGRRRVFPWLATSHCRAWDPDAPKGVCRCPGFEPKR